MKKFFKWFFKILGFGKGNSKDSLTIPPVPVPVPPDPTPVPTPDPTPIPVDTPPDPIDWESMTCPEIKEKISEIELLLITSKFIEVIRKYWEDELEKGLKVYSMKCGG